MNPSRRTQEQTDRLRRLIEVEKCTAKQVYQAMSPVPQTTLRSWWVQLGIKPREVTKEERYAINCKAHFTDEMRAVVDQVRALAPTSTAADIAAVVRRTPNAVRSLCTRHGIEPIRVQRGRKRRA